MDLAFDLFECHVALLPIWHLECLHEVEYYLHLPVVLLDVVGGRLEVASDLVHHAASYVVELHRLVYYVPDVRQLVDPLFTSQSDLGRYSVHPLDHLHHILECTLDGLLELFLVGVK